MKTIHKFVMLDSPEEGISGYAEMNQGAAIRDVGEQDGSVYVWAEVDSTRPMAFHDFVVVGTGHPLPEEAGRFIKTVHMNSGLVWHVYHHRSAIIEAEDLRS